MPTVDNMFYYYLAVLDLSPALFLSYKYFLMN